MSSKTIVVLLIAVVMVAGVRCQEGYGQMYCGRRLASALAMLCDDMNLVKRSHVRVQYDWPWLVTRHTRSLAGSRHRNKRQVVSECCDKPCTVDELLSYC